MAEQTNGNPGARWDGRNDTNRIKKKRKKKRKYDDRTRRFFQLAYAR